MAFIEVFTKSRHCLLHWKVDKKTRSLKNSIEKIITHSINPKVIPTEKTVINKIGIKIIFYFLLS